MLEQQEKEGKVFERKKGRAKSVLCSGTGRESYEAHKGVQTGQQFPGNIPGSGANRQVALGMPKKAAPEVSELSLPPNYQALSGHQKGRVFGPEEIMQSVVSK